MHKELITGLAIFGLTVSGCARTPALTNASGMPGPATGEDPNAAETTDDTATRLQADLAMVAGSDRVFFDRDSSTLSIDARQILARHIEWLRQHPSVSFTIEGHCDERGTREYNLALGERRATAVTNFLSANGIATQRLRTISYGKERPEMLGSNEAAHAQNRRAVSLAVVR